jgi:hypothetical protein
MDETEVTSELPQETADRHAILMMLCYVETECRRLGCEDAARYVSLAARLMQPVAHETHGAAHALAGAAGAPLH